MKRTVTTTEAADLDYLITTRQAAYMLQTTTAQVRVWASRGKLCPAAERGPRETLMFEAADVQALVVRRVAC